VTTVPAPPDIDKVSTEEFGSFRRTESPLLSVVIPAYNESRRLGSTLDHALAYLADQPYGWELLVSDDGSRDDTVAIARSYEARWPQIRVLVAPQNRGKGAAVRQGVLMASGKYVVFADADLATPLGDIERLLPYLEDGYDVAIGSRALPDSTILTLQPLPRQVMGKVFRRLVRRVALPDLHDTQCGFKAFRTTAARHIFAQLYTERFAFDVEALLLANALGYRVKEVGVRWADRAGTTVNPILDSWTMLRDVYRLRKGVDERLEDALQSMPGESERCLALVTLTEQSTKRELPVQGLVSNVDHACDTEVLEHHHSAAMLATFARTGVQARAAATEMAAATTATLARTGVSSTVTSDVQRLPLATPITWIRERELPDDLALQDGMLTKLRVQQEAHEADVRAFGRRREEWRKRNSTLRILVVVNSFMLVWWLMWLYDFGHAASTFLYSSLVVAETFSVLQVLGYWYTIWHEREPERKRGRVPGRVDVFIPTYNEPVELVAQTVAAALAMPYPHRTYVLDDGNRPEMGEMARRLGAEWITRADNRGAKAGNINHALSVTDGDFFVIFDADHLPHSNFLSRMMPFMDESRMGFVQAPQYYANRERTYVAGAAMDQQEIFFGPICSGKDGLGAVFCCGTNVVIRRAAIEDVGGFRENSITEDAVTSLDLHERGWKSRYVPERLAEGLAPEDLGSYLSQQRRWARGNLEMLFKSRVLRRRMPLRLRLQYVWSSMYYLTGLTALVYLSLPVLFLVFGIQAVNSRSGDFIAHFFPYIFLTIFILARSAEGRLRFRAIQFGYGLFPLFLEALVQALTGKKVGFQVTPKEGTRQSFYHLVIPQIAAVSVLLFSIGFGFFHYSGVRTVTNASWALFNVFVLSAIIRAAAPQSRTEVGVVESEHEPERRQRLSA